MPTLALNHYNIRVDKPTTAAVVRFYVDIVGLHEGWRPPFNFPGHWLYAGDRAVLHLVEDDTVKLQDMKAARAIDHVAFTCDGAPAFADMLHAKGIACRKATVPGTTQLQFFLTDPAGNGVELNFTNGS